MADEKKADRLKQKKPSLLTKIKVRGFKCFRDETEIEIRPLTILAGANSSGKSSIMQPLLLMKQTLQDVADPGPLKLDGPNVTFSSFDQMLWKGAGDDASDEFMVGLMNSQ